MLVTARLGPSVIEDQRPRLALQQQRHPEQLLIGLGDHLVGFDVTGTGHREPLGELNVTEVVEQVNLAQLLKPDRSVGHASTRYSWISEMAIDPSPTALATRLIERARTSPATNTPGTVVSST